MCDEAAVVEDVCATALTVFTCGLWWPSLPRPRPAYLGPSGSAPAGPMPLAIATSFAPQLAIIEAVQEAVGDGLEPKHANVLLNWELSRGSRVHVLTPILVGAGRIDDGLDEQL